MKVNSIAASLPRKVSSVEPFYSSTISAEIITLKQNWIDSQSCEISFLGLKANPWNKSVPELEIYPKTVSVSYFEADSKFILRDIENFQGVKILFLFSGIEKEFVIQPPINNFDLFYRKRSLITKLNGRMVRNYYYTIRHPKFGEVYNSQGTLFSSNGSYFDDKFIDFLFDELIESIELEVSVFSRSDDSLFSKFSHTLDPPGLEFFDLDIKSELIFDEKDGYIAKLEIKNFPPSINNLSGKLEYIDNNHNSKRCDVNLRNTGNKNFIIVEIPIKFESIYDESNKFMLLLDDSKHYNLELINPNSLSISVKENINHLDSNLNLVEIESSGEWNGKLQFSISSSYLNPNDTDLEFNFKTEISNSLSMSLVELREKLPLIDRIFETNKHPDISIQIKLYPFDSEKDYTEFSTTINRFEHPIVKLIRNHDLEEFQNEFIFHENDELNILAFKYCVPYFSDPNFILRIGGREIKAIETNIEKDYFREINFDISEIKYEDLFKNNRWALKYGSKELIKGKIELNSIEFSMLNEVKIYIHDGEYFFPEAWKFRSLWPTNLKFTLSLTTKQSLELLIGTINEYSVFNTDSNSITLKNLLRQKEISTEMISEVKSFLELKIQSRPLQKVRLIVEDTPSSEHLLNNLEDWIKNIWNGNYEMIEKHPFKDELIIIIYNLFNSLNTNQKYLFSSSNKDSKNYEIMSRLKEIFSSHFDLPEVAEKLMPKDSPGSVRINSAIELYEFINKEFKKIDSQSKLESIHKHGYLYPSIHEYQIKIKKHLDDLKRFYILNDNIIRRKVISWNNLLNTYSILPLNFLKRGLTKEDYYYMLENFYQKLIKEKAFKLPLDKFQFGRRVGSSINFENARKKILENIELELSHLRKQYESQIKLDNSNISERRKMAEENKPQKIEKIISGKRRTEPINPFARNAAAERNKRQADRANIRNKEVEKAQNNQKSNIKSSKKSIKDVDESKDIENFDPGVKAKILDLEEKRDNALKNKLDSQARSYQKKIDKWKNPDWVSRKNRKNRVNKMNRNSRNSRNKIQGKGDEK